MKCEEVLELIAGGATDGAVAAHLAVCPDCRMRRGYARVLGERLGDPLMWEQPPARLEAAVLAAVAAEPSPARRRRLSWWMMAGAAVLAAAVLTAVWLSSRPDWVVELESGPAAARASGVVAGWNLEHGTRMVLDVSGLETTTSDAYYEVWLTAPDGRHVSAGTFRGAGRFEVVAGVRRADFPRIWITREPADDDPSPFPATVLDTPEG